jgi:sodium transport system ATP-binding protein
VLRKEVREGFRDRRSVVTALFFPALGPVLLVVMLSLVSQSSREADEKGVAIPVAGREHVLYFGELQGLSGDRLARRADDLVRRLGMEDFADRRADGFSQGQRVKVALARALVHDPPNVVLDEPTNGLDVAATRQVRSLLRDLRDQGRCVLFSSHVMQEVSALCDRVVVIARGRVVAEGTPDDLRRQTGREHLEDAFVDAIGSEEGLA